MASELNYDALVRLVKSNKDITQAEAARRLGLSVGQIPMIKFCQAQVAVGVYSKIPGTAAAVKKARDSEGNRWELIAARTGKSVAAVKDLYPGDASSSYTGRGRNFNGVSSGSRKKTSSTSSARKTAATGSRKTASTGSRKTASTGTGRKKTASASSARKRGSVVRNRGGRPSARGANPS